VAKGGAGRPAAPGGRPRNLGTVAGTTRPRRSVFPAVPGSNNIIHTPGIPVPAPRPRSWNRAGAPVGGAALQPDGRPDGVFGGGSTQAAALT